VIRVSVESKISGVAGAIATVIREEESVTVQAMGMRAVYQAVKSVALAEEYLREDGVEIVERISKVIVDMDGEDRHAFRIEVSKAMSLQ